MSEETKATIDFEYEDQFSYVTEEGTLMLKATALFSERKIAEIADEKEVSAIVEQHKEAFKELEQKVELLLASEENSTETIESLFEELKTSTAIGDYEKLFSRLNEEKNLLETTSKQENKISLEDQNEASSTEVTDEKNTDRTDQPGNLSYYQEIVDKAEDLSKQSDWPYVSMELDNLSHQWDEEGPDVEEEAIEQKKELFSQFQNIRDTFEQRKKEHYEELKHQKKKNLNTKKELLQKLQGIVSEENWSAAKEVNHIKGQWNNIGILPSGEGETLAEKFSELLKEFEEHKVDRLVNKRQQEEDNLTGKLIVLDKMEKLIDSLNEKTGDWKIIDKKFDNLTRQYKRIGRVPPEKSSEVWGRYKSAQDVYYDKKYKYDQKYRQKFDKNYQKKEDLCRKAEALMKEDDLPKAAKELNKLHRRWKKTGNLPQQDEDKLWTRFKEATDAFNDYKSKNIDELREQEETHLQQKQELIEKARNINDIKDWDKGHSKMQSLLDQWKKVGPVPRNKSRMLWKQFKEAQDVFYERRREHFKEQKDKQKENLKKKEEILEKLQELGTHKDPYEAVEQAKPLQEEFKQIGYVPIKKKNQIWKEYRESCDVIYERFRAAKSGNKFDQELAKADIKPDKRSKIINMRKKYQKARKEIKELAQEVLQYKETKTYFKSSDKDNPLLNEIKTKIEKAENRLQEKQDQMDELDQKIDELRKSE